MLPGQLRSVAVVTVMTALTLSLAACDSEPTPKERVNNRALPTLAINIKETSVSGISSGAYMAGQFQFAHGELVVGAAIIAGGPYGCAESTFADVIQGPGTAFLNLSRAVNGCMRDTLRSWGVPDAMELAKKATKRATTGRIASIGDIKSDKIYLFSGRADNTVAPSIVASAADFYRNLGVGAENIVAVTDKEAGHAFVTETHGGACNVSQSPYLVDCDYDQAGALLSHIYGTLQPPTSTTTGEFRRFDQTPFTKDLGDHGLAVTGAVYIPKSCEVETCRVHIAYHGCAQNRQSVGGRFIEQSGFARWADTNRIVVLFPQTSSSPLNPQGCWDWWGFTSNDYLTRKAPQIIAVHRMLSQLAKPPGASIGNQPN